MSENKMSYELLAKVLIVFGIVLIIIEFLVFAFFDNSVHEKLGQIGEYTGGVVGSFWTLAAIALYYAALKKQGREFELQREQLEMQRTELALQRHETELQRLEFERQTDQLRTQNETLAEQKYENTFFQLLDLHTEIVRNNEDRDLGKKWANTLYLRFIGKYQRLTEKLESQENIDYIELISESYETFPKRTEYLDKYFANMFYLVNFVDKSAFKQKEFYYGILMSQLNVYEQILLFYYCLSKNSDPKFKIFIEENSLLVNLPKHELMDSKHLQYYKESAFSKN